MYTAFCANLNVVYNGTAVLASLTGGGKFPIVLWKALKLNKFVIE